MDPDGSMTVYILLLAAFVALNAFFSMSEIAIVTLNDSKVRKLAQDGDKRARRLVQLIDEPSKFLTTIQVGVTLSGFFTIGVSVRGFTGYLYTALVSSPLFFSPTLSGVLSLLLITCATALVSLVFGELVPKRLGMQYYEKVALAISGPLTMLFALEKPFVWFLSKITNVILRLLGIDPDHRPEQVTEEEIRMLIDVGNESGNIEAVDKDMINNIFEFDDRTAADMMTHRTEVEAILVDAPLEEIVQLAVESGYSRIPVYKEDLDSIVGILYVKDLLDRVTKNPEADFSLEGYLRKPMYVLESTNGKMLLSQFKAQKIQMAVVVDEYGGTSGIVTMEDLLEAIVGNIQDEYDDEEEEITQLTENCYLVDGLADLEMVAKFFSFTVHEEDEEEFDTIGGYIVHQLGYLPNDQQHPTIQIDNVRFVVDEMEERRISKLKAELLPAAPTPEDTETDGKRPAEKIR